MYQGCWFDPQSGHMQEATGERMDSGTISHSLSQKKKKERVSSMQPACWVHISQRDGGRRGAGP